LLFAIARLVGGMKFVLVNRFCFPDEAATSRLVSSLAFSLRREGLPMHILASRMDHQRAAHRPPARESIEGVQIHRIWSSRFGRQRLLGRAIDYLTFYLSACCWLLRKLKPGDVCILCTDPPLLSVVALAPIALKRAVPINWIMDLFPEVAIELGRMPRLAARIAVRLRDISLRRVRCAVALTGRMADQLKRSGLAADRLRVVYPWSDGDAIVPVAAADNRLRQDWGLVGQFVLAYSGNMGRAHEFGTFLDAATLLRERGDTVFLFIGDGHRHDWVVREVAQRRLANVVFKPLQPLEQLSHSLGVADVHLVSLLPEMEPLVIPSKFFGILAAGRPTLFVGAPDGEIARLIQAGDCGASVPIGQPELLVEWILRLRQDAQLRRAMGWNARRLFDARFTRSAATGEWARLLRSVAAHPDALCDAVATPRMPASGVRSP
jgi:colanic acid biosynthesis glycosyl transferase WcaI